MNLMNDNNEFNQQFNLQNNNYDIDPNKINNNMIIRNNNNFIMYNNRNN